MLSDEDTSATDPATLAFESLRVEVTVVRQSLEKLAALERHRVPDYTTTLGFIAKELAGVRQRLEVIEKHPALRTTPERQAKAIEQIGTGMVRETVSNLNRAIRNIAEERGQLARIIGVSREKVEQRRWLMGTAAAGLAAGLVLFPLFGNILPIAISTRMAAITVGEDRWNAGIALLRAVDSQGTNDLAYASQLWRDNADAIGACRQSAYQSGKVHSCTLSVKPGK